jgi:hypothetical protein
MIKINQENTNTGKTIDMKTIVVKITTEKVYKIEFDETVFDKEIIDNYKLHFDKGVKEVPREINHLDLDEQKERGITEDDYPFLNMAKQIAYLKSEYDSLNNEGMPDIHETIYTKDKDATYGAYLTEESMDYDFEFDLDNFKHE